MSALRKSLIPVDPENLTEADHSRVLKAVDAFASLAERVAEYIKEEAERPLKPAESSRYWKAGIFWWMKYLFDHYDPPIGSDVPDRWTAISYVSCVLTFFAKADYDLITEDDRPAFLACQLWFVTDYDYQRSKYSRSCGWWDPAIELFCIAMVSNQIPLYAYCFHKGIGIRYMMNLILTRIRICNEIEDCDHHQYSYLHVFLDLYIFQTSLVPVNRISTVLASTAEHNMLRRNGHSFFYISLKYLALLQKHLTFAKSIQAVIAAIRAGFLRAIVAQCNSYYNLANDDELPKVESDFLRDKVETVILLISQTLPQYMVFHSVMLEIDAQLKKIDDEHIPETLIAQEWETFRRLHSGNLSFLNTNRPLLCHCVNLMHDITDNRGTTFQCSGCEKAVYCSEKCQKEDWAAVHRHECRKNAPKSDKFKDAILRKRDHHSVCRFAIMSTILQWESIQERAQREHPDLSLSDLTIYFDYTKFPPEILLKERGAIAASAAKYVPNATIIQCHIPLGLYRATITAAGDMNEAETKSWVTRAPKFYTYNDPVLPILEKGIKVDE